MNDRDKMVGAMVSEASTLCPESAATAAWVRVASFSAASLMVPSLRDSLSAPMAMPSASLSSSATV